MRHADSSARIIVFDGLCHLCSGWASFLGRHRIDPPFQLVPMQSAEGRDLLLAHGMNPDDPTSFLVLDRGLALTESAAALHVIASLGGAWPMVNIVRVLPRTWCDSSYRLLARNRYRWFGRRRTCYLPR